MFTYLLPSFCLFTLSVQGHLQRLSLRQMKVILACGPYADALRADPELTRAIFGNAKVISSVNDKKIPQLSFAISDELLREIAKQV